MALREGARPTLDVVVVAGDEFRHDRMKVHGDSDRGIVTFEVSGGDSIVLTQELTKDQLSVLVRYLQQLYGIMR